MEDHIVLYRQYRPLTFDDVVGQEAAVCALRQSVISKKLAHAYMFCGQHGTGKTTIAKIFARAVNCEHPVNGNPCNECPTCKGILDGSILDVSEMDAASNNGVDDIRPILQEVNFAPTRTTYKVYIIDEVHMLSKGAFNALLKTIEEPPKHVLFLFATTESDKIPATIISRCQRYDFKRIPIDLISGRLREVCNKSNIKATDDALRLIASRSDGALRDALSLLDQISAISGEENEINSGDVERITGTVDSSFLFKMANCLIDARFDELIDLCAILNASGKNQARFTLDLAAYFRDLLIIRIKADPLVYLPYPKETIKDMYQTSAKVSADTLTGYISFLSKEYAELRKSPDIPTSFELMLMRLCGRKSSLPVTPIVIPDFEKKQAEKAAEITISEPEHKKAEEPKEAPSVSSSEQTETAQETTQATNPSEKSDPAPEQTSGESSSDEPAKTESQPAPAPAPYRPRPSSTPSSAFSFGSAAGEYKVSSEESTESELSPSVLPFASLDQDIPDPEEPADTDDNDDAYIPADDSFASHTEPTIFSFMQKETESPFSFSSFDTDTTDKKDTPAESGSVFSSKGLFSGLSSSFLQDLEDDNNEDTEEEKQVEPAPVMPRSQLAKQVDKSGVIVDARSKETVRTPSFTDKDADIAFRWTGLTSKLKESNDNIAGVLEHSSLKKDGTSAFIVFEDKDQKLLTNLKKSQAFRQISSGIKEEFEVEHLYLCTSTQYSNQEKKSRESENDRKLDEFSEHSRSMGIPTDVHFGD